MSSYRAFCVICLRIDRKLRRIPAVLSEYHDELSDFLIEDMSREYCSECEHLLRKTFNFHNRCKASANILNKWNKMKGKSKSPIDELHLKLPSRHLSVWTPENSKVISYKDSDNPDQVTIKEELDEENVHQENLFKMEIHYESDTATQVLETHLQNSNEVGNTEYYIENKLPITNDIPSDTVLNASEIIDYTNSTTTNEMPISNHTQVVTNISNTTNNLPILTDDKTIITNDIPIGIANNAIKNEQNICDDEEHSCLKEEQNDDDEMQDDVIFKTDDDCDDYLIPLSPPHKKTKLKMTKTPKKSRSTVLLTEKNIETINVSLKNRENREIPCFQEMGEPNVTNDDIYEKNPAMSKTVVKRGVPSKLTHTIADLDTINNQCSADIVEDFKIELQNPKERNTLVSWYGYSTVMEHDYCIPEVRTRDEIVHMVRSTTEALGHRILDCDTGSPAPPSPSRPAIQRALSDREARELLENYGCEADSDEVEEDADDLPFCIRTCHSDFYTDIDDEQPTTDNVTATASNNSETNTVRPNNFFDYEWRTISDPPISHEKRRETFSSEQGPTAPNADPYSNFVSIWDRQIMEHIASETNAYAQEWAATMSNNAYYCCSWKDVTVDELYTLWAIFLAMGIFIKGKITAYWSTATDIFITPGFRVNMSLRRFQLLCNCLHFNRNGQMPSGLDPYQARLFKIQPIVSHLNDKFQNLYCLSQNIALDESLLQWSNRVSMNQFLLNKVVHVGIKSFEICECQTGYLWRFEIHSIKHIQPPVTDPMGDTTQAIVLSLFDGLQNKGHTLWMEDYYSSPALARKLKTLGTDCVGTLRTNRQFVPDSVQELTKENMRPGQISAVTSGDVDLLVWRDQRSINRVATISTYHGNGVTRASGSLEPIAIHDYNIMMGGVQKKDHLLSCFPMERNCTQIWYKKLFKRLLNVSVLNAHIISQKSGSTLSHRDFRSQLVLDILEKHAHNS